MKPEHFIYKSDGLYYMQNMPEKPVANRSGFGMFNMFEYESKLAEYKAALERAKAEAVLVTDPYVYQIAMHRYFPHFIDYSKTPQDNFAMCASIGQVYLLNMEENIEVVRLPCGCGGDICECNNQPIARIVAPKKEEESEKQVFIVNDLLKPAFKKAELFRRGHNLNGRKINRDQYYEILSELREHINQKFEIKRKPL